MKEKLYNIATSILVYLLLIYYTIKTFVLAGYDILTAESRSKKQKDDKKN